jgi:ABC-2 type transport system permease protein
MFNFWVVAGYEYSRRVGKRSFLLGTLGVPLMMSAIMAMIVFTAISGSDKRPVGYVDAAGILAKATPPASNEFLAFENESTARRALELKEIRAYYVIPAGYPTQANIDLYYQEKALSQILQQKFAGFMRTGLSAGFSESIRTRLIEGPRLTLRSLDGSREIKADSIQNIVLPFLLGFLLIFIVMTSAGYMLQAVSDEKENRTIEVLVTSITPEQLLGGKALGLMAVSMTQIIVWMGVLLVGVGVGGLYFESLRTIRIPWDFVVVVVLFFLPTFALINSIMVAIGGMVTEMRQGQQVAGMLNMLFILPSFFSGFAFSNPNHPLLVGFSLFPTTALITICMRWTTTFIPIWQLILSWILLVISTGISIWAGGRIFRHGMLQYGQRLSLRSALSSLRR